MTDRQRSNAVFLDRESWEKLRAAASQAVEFKDLLQRVQADFINYQDRVKRERADQSKYLVSDFARELLPGLDSLAESEKTLRAAGAPDAVLDGVRILRKEFLRILAKQGVAPIEAVGKPFDPAFHEAIGTVEAAGAAPNSVVEEVRGGWLIHGRVLRAAMVRVAKS